MVICAVAIVGIALPLYVTSTMPDEVRLTGAEFSNNRAIYVPYSRLVRQSTNFDTVVGEDCEKYVQLKLFGLIPIRRIKVDLMPFDTVIPGGHTIGFLAQIGGALVTRDSECGKLEKGDIIHTIDGKEVSGLADFDGFRESSKAKTHHDLVIDRRGKERDIRIENKPQLGVWLKDETSGVGTLTYINPANNNFASLGHRLSDFETGTNVDVRGGTIHTTNIVGIEKSVGKQVGSYKSVLRRPVHPTLPEVRTAKDTSQGEITSSNFSGVFGCLFSDSNFLKDGKPLPVSSRYNVKPGKATLRTTIDNSGPREFDIEIVKTRFQRKPSTKSMIVRVTDKELLEKTGGIIHGMSGSPIIQDGKVVGALTHVVLGDCSKGYGIYIDFVLP